jgi:hypothetical protein
VSTTPRSLAIPAMSYLPVDVLGVGARKRSKGLYNYINGGSFSWLLTPHVSFFFVSSRVAKILLISLLNSGCVLEGNFCLLVFDLRGLGISKTDNQLGRDDRWEAGELRG